jgi:hypothetical protein
MSKYDEFFFVWQIRPANIEDKHKHVWTALDDEGSGYAITQFLKVKSQRDFE